MMFSCCENRFDKSWQSFSSKCLFKTANAQIDGAEFHQTFLEAGQPADDLTNILVLADLRLSLFGVMHVRHLLLAAEENGI